MNARFRVNLFTHHMYHTKSMCITNYTTKTLIISIPSRLANMTFAIQSSNKNKVQNHASHIILITCKSKLKKKI